ncbi:MAG: DUF4307 domain-containing protein [Microbacterium sp.]
MPSTTSPHARPDDRHVDGVDGVDADAAVRAELDDRYGRRRGGRRGVWIVVGALALAIVGYFSWSTVSQSMDSVDVDNTAFHLVDAHSVTVRVPGDPAPRRRRLVRHRHRTPTTGVVGWRIVEYPADDAHSRSFTETIPTVAEATTGLATSCWIP